MSSLNSEKDKLHGCSHDNRIHLIHIHVLTNVNQTWDHVIVKVNLHIYKQYERCFNIQDIYFCNHGNDTILKALQNRLVKLVCKIKFKSIEHKLNGKMLVGAMFHRLFGT